MAAQNKQGSSNVTSAQQAPDPRNWSQLDPEDTLYIDTVHGRIVRTGLLKNNPTEVAQKMAQFSSFGDAYIAIAGQIVSAIQNAELFQAINVERGRLRALVESSRDGVVLVGLDQRLLVVNQHALRFLGLPGAPEAWVDRSIWDALHALRGHASQLVKVVVVELRRLRGVLDDLFDQPRHVGARGIAQERQRHAGAAGQAKQRPAFAVGT